MSSSNWSWSWSLRLAWIEVGVEVTTCPDGWVVGGWKIMQSQLQTEVGVKVWAELGNTWISGPVWFANKNVSFAYKNTVPKAGWQNCIFSP